MSSSIGWNFENSNSGDVEGLNDGGVETFRDDHLLSLAKESAQNSLDARKDKSKPVILEFKTFEIETKDFPDIGNFKKILDLQIEYWKKAKRDSSSEHFFKKARNILDSKKITCLRISDFNTTGLDGIDKGKNEPYSRWWKLVRSKGVTDNDPLDGGSFGLGKFASFACSNLRTVFYNTTDLDGNEANQGVSILASFDTEQGKRKRGKGYYCNSEDFSCLKSQINLDKEYKRKKPGTDIYILSFRDDDAQLEDKLFSSILRSFLLAIYEEKLIFKLNGKKIDKLSLRKLIDRYRNEKFKELVPSETIEYYDILEGEHESKDFYLSLFEEKDVLLKISIKTGLSKKIGMFRNNGMKIFDQRRIKSYNDYAGMLFLRGEKVNAYFRKLENPEHDNWRPERSDKPEVAKQNIQKLRDFMRKNLKDLENITLPESENVGGINSLLDEDYGQGDKKIRGLEFKPLKIIESKRRASEKTKLTRKARKRRKRIVPRKPDPFPEPFPEVLDPKKKAKKEIFVEEINLLDLGNGEYNLIFKTEENLDSASIELFIGGEIENEEIEVLEASLPENKEILKVSKNKIKLGKIEKGKLNKLKFRINDEIAWALEVNFYEN
tara:strand:- start:2849 stop:4672 length:1824 start_codon:yes stop_codon:yes gene_type:complete